MEAETMENAKEILLTTLYFIVVNVKDELVKVDSRIEFVRRITLSSTTSETNVSTMPYSAGDAFSCTRRILRRHYKFSQSTSSFTVVYVLYRLCSPCISVEEDPGSFLEGDDPWNQLMLHSLHRLVLSTTSICVISSLSPPLIFAF
ncbi:hypothetical protein F2Q70_00043397 [Brassica cretica]|uniref:Uncharacterized protein n=2 Tax=Brassica cretica TaxID=69181 RepID=A0A3N6TS15_BRACR|nr:hypothetical protein F2Q70_00043397 [Brassica cretica]KAF3520727.1 hypothetical protein DY000_02060474 [Brassica cretica]